MKSPRASDISSSLRGHIEMVIRPISTHSSLKQSLWGFGGSSPSNPILGKSFPSPVAPSYLAEIHCIISGYLSLLNIWLNLVGIMNTTMAMDKCNFAHEAHFTIWCTAQEDKIGFICIKSSQFLDILFQMLFFSFLFCSLSFLKKALQRTEAGAGFAHAFSQPHRKWNSSLCPESTSHLCSEVNSDKRETVTSAQAEINSIVFSSSIKDLN